MDISDRAISSSGQQLSAHPHLNGRLYTDEATLAAVADNYGHIVHQLPAAVLRPNSYTDVVNVIEYARSHGLHIAPRGAGHNTYKQAQAKDGIVIDMTTLRQIHEFDEGSVLVDAGVRWSDLLAEALQRGLTPPTLTDYLDLSVGGTLSVGGIGGQSFRYGTQTDNVLELQVVTGAGELVRCSPAEHAELFNACRAGLGQCGVIVAARLRLIPAPSSARIYTIFFPDLQTSLAEQERLIDQNYFDYLCGFIVPLESQGWGYMLLAALFYSEEPPFDTQRLLSELGYPPEAVTVEDRSYLDFVSRTDQEWVPMMRSSGLWDVPHPWLDLFLPASQSAEFIQHTFATLPEEQLRNSLILTYPLNRANCRTPYFCLPDERHSFLFDILTHAVPPTAETLTRILADHRRLYDEARGIGATTYPIGALEMTHEDWRQQFGPRWQSFLNNKRRFDPDGILTPGQGMPDA